VIDCDVQYDLLFLTVVLSMINNFLLFYIVVSKCEEWKVEAFLWSASGDSWHRYATAVGHAVGYYLAGSKCKPNLCQKSLLFW